MDLLRLLRFIIPWCRTVAIRAQPLAAMLSVAPPQLTAVRASHENIVASLAQTNPEHTLIESTQPRGDARVAGQAH
jgi:hypothetical protein